jgi:hypothetical protein
MGGILQSVINFKIRTELISSHIPPPIQILGNGAEVGGSNEASEVAGTQNISTYKWKVILKEELLNCLTSSGGATGRCRLAGQIVSF